MSEMKFFRMQSKLNYPPLHNFWEYAAALKQIEMYELQIHSTPGLSNKDQLKEYAELVQRADDFEAEHKIESKRHE